LKESVSAFGASGEMKVGLELMIDFKSMENVPVRRDSPRRRKIGD
jgi:hypothetical protein